jgi:hypothetical protein
LLNTGLIDNRTLINIDYYMAFFISYPLSAIGHDMSLRSDRVEGWYMNENEKMKNDMLYTSREKITDFYQNVFQWIHKGYDMKNAM